jgi:hypothetical protein
VQGFGDIGLAGKLVDLKPWMLGLQYHQRTSVLADREHEAFLNPPGPHTTWRSMLVYNELRCGFGSRHTGGVRSFASASEVCQVSEPNRDALA